MTGRRDEGAGPGRGTSGDAGQPAPAGGRAWRRAVIAAVAVVTVVVVAAAAWNRLGPDASPRASAPSATSPAPTPVPAPITTQPPTPVPTTEPSPTGEAFGTWEVALHPGEQGGTVSITVVDLSGTMTGAAEGSLLVPLVEPGAPQGLGIGPGSDDHAITVGWTGGACDEHARLDLAPDGRTLALRFPPRPGCDAVGIGMAVELRFAQAVDPAAFTGLWTTDLVRVTDVTPRVIAFAGERHGFVGGTSVYGDAVILETTDGGATWDVGGLGTGQVSDIALAGDGTAYAGRTCDDAPDSCDPGLYRSEDGGWTWAELDWPIDLSFTGADGAGLFLGEDAPRLGSGLPVPEVRLTADDGETWTAATSPCPDRPEPAITRLDATSLVMLCGGEGATGGSLKDIYRSDDAGASWSNIAEGPWSGTGMRLDLAEDGSGWMWGNRSPLLVSSDGGATWTPNDVADGDLRIALGADYHLGGVGFLLIWDPGRQATLLLHTVDSQAWTELSAFPAVPKPDD